MDLEARFWQKLEQFTVDPFDPSLKTHKLSGKLKEFWSFSVDYDERVLFYFTEGEKAVLVDIGSHDEVYWAGAVAAAQQHCCSGLNQVSGVDAKITDSRWPKPLCPC